MNYMIGIVTHNRYDALNVLLKSLRNIKVPILVIDSSLNPQSTTNNIVYHNDLKGYQSVVHNKNIIIHNFLKNHYDYLFIIEDDIKILDIDVFDQYIEISKKYNIPHMNFGGRIDNQIVYDLNNDITIYENLQGCFSFYSKTALQKVGLMSPKLDKNCWEHIEHTIKIHQIYNYNPIFYHFPDIKNSWHYILMQDIPSIINSPEQQNIVQKYKKIMLNNLRWKSLPDVSIKRFDLTSLKFYK